MWRFAVAGLLALTIWSINAVLPAAQDDAHLSTLTVNAAGDAAIGLDIPVKAEVATKAEIIPAPALARRTMPVVVARASEVQPQIGGNPADTTAIIMELQGQLRRVGCFKGASNGRWDAATRRSMARFNDRVNAHFPLDELDPVFLTLVEKYDNRACGAPCMPGLSPDAKGLCVAAQSVATAIPQPLESPKPVAIASNDWAPPVVSAGPKPGVHPKLAAAAKLTAVKTAALVVPKPIEVIAPLAKDLPMVLAQMQPTETALGASSAAAANPAQTTIVALVASPHKKKHARKSTGWGNTQYALGASGTRTRRYSSGWTFTDKAVLGVLGVVLSRH